MTTTAAPTRPTAPTRAAPPVGQPASRANFTTSKGVARTAWKLGIYGPEGIGKSSAAALCPGVVFADLENSTLDLDVTRVDGIATTDYAASWSNLRRFIQQVDSGIICIDSMTRAEDWATAWVVKNKKSNDGNNAADSLEDFKYKAGLTFVVDEFRRLLSDIENAFLRGVSFILVAHARVSRIKNPDGSDFIRYEPRLVDDPKGSNMLQFVQFLDHLVFVDLDKEIKQGKATGKGLRVMYLDTSPSRMSKTRSLPTDKMYFEPGETQLWELLGVKA